MIDVSPAGGGKGPRVPPKVEQPNKGEKVDAPARYADPEKTDLRLTVTGGKQQFDIVMQPE